MSWTDKACFVYVLKLKFFTLFDGLEDSVSFCSLKLVDTFGKLKLFSAVEPLELIEPFQPDKDRRLPESVKGVSMIQKA